MQFKKFGKYSVIKKIASGGMADILLSISLSPTGFGRFVVIKKALAKFSDNQDFNEMFKNEAKVACNLKHKNITPIYEFGVEKEQFFLTMEYISGKNLREVTKKIASQRKEIGIDNAIYIVKEVAAGLNYAHNAIDSNTGLPLSIIHRDVSPQNIMVSFDGEIKLIDFGIAKISDSNLTKAGHLKGKFSYMSPEQAQGEKLDERTDIFCLGIILWELLTGKRLFASENEMSSLKKVRNCNIPPAQKINPKIPTELNEIVMKALSKNKNLRYKTASKFERDLNLFLNKNYPEYSHYNLTFLIKTAYRKEVMQERERLKIYSSEFKKYINVLNLEKSMSHSGINLKTIGMDISNQASPNTRDESLIKTKTRGATHQDSHLSLVESEAEGEYESEAGSLPLSEEISKRSTQSASTLRVQKQTESSVLQKIAEGNLALPIKADKQASEGLTRKTEFQNPKNFQKLQKSKSASTTLEESIKTPFDFNRIKVEPPNPAQTSYTINTDFSNSAGATSLLSNKSSFFQTLDTTELLAQKKKKKKTFLLKSVAGLGGLALLVGLGFFYFQDFLFEKKLISISSQAPQAEKAISNQKHQPLQNADPKSSPRSAPPVETYSKNSPAKKAPLAKSPYRKFFVRSRPSNAGIYINNKFTSKYTPYIITVYADRTYSVTIKKPGYLPKSFQVKPGQSQNSIEIHLNRKDRQGRNSILIVD